MDTNIIKCKNCGQEIAADSSFCQNCGTKVEVETEASKYCTSCGAELPEGTKFCTKCGASVVATVQPEGTIGKTIKPKKIKTKKPIFKKWWFWLIVVIIFIGIIGSAGGSSEAEVPESSTIEPVETISEPSSESEVAPEETKPSSDVTNEEDISIESIIDLIELSLDSFDYCSVEYNENGFVVDITSEGMGEAVSILKSFGLDETTSEWAEARNNMVLMCDSCIEMIETFGINDPDVTLNLLDDTNHNNIIIIVKNGVVVYDALAEGNTQSTQTTQSQSNNSSMTIGQKNALRSAEAYLDMMAFSRSELIDQLEFEGYSHNDAVFAVDNCGADWYEQAAKSAEEYLDLMPFSRSELIDQLEFEGFTHDQAVYGVEANGY